MEDKIVFRNVNIGISTEDISLANVIESELNDNGVYFTNEGSNKDTYNINAGFENIEEADIFADRWSQETYIETESFTKEDLS